jgi:hypothetical protein
MRLTVFGVLAVTLSTVACSRADTAIAASDADQAKKPGATTGSAAVTRAPVVSTREVTIPAGTPLSIVLETAVSSNGSRAEQPVAARVARPIVIDGATVVAEGSRVGGVVTDARQSGRVKGRAHVALRFDSLTPSGSDERYTIHTASVGRTAAATKRKDAVEIGAPAAGGALIGALVGGKKGALVGGAVGGGAGTAVVLSTRGKEVKLPQGTALTLKLTAPVTVRTRA